MHNDSPTILRAASLTSESELLPPAFRRRRRALMETASEFASRPERVNTKWMTSPSSLPSLEKVSAEFRKVSVELQEGVHSASRMRP